MSGEWTVFPLADVTILLFVILIIMLVVQIMTLRVLRSFQPPQEKSSDKKQMDKLTFKDLR